MPFPEVERVVYDINPLINVVCQLRYPTILKVEAELPNDFQKALNNFYPVVNEAYEYMPELSIQTKTDLEKEPIFNVQQPSIKPNKNYTFSSEDDLWKVNLTKNFIALSSSKYTQWEEFRNRLKIIIAFFEQYYEPPFYSRIGLRYIDVFERSKYNLGEKPWSDLINSSFLGLISENYGDSVENYESITEIPLIDPTCAAKIKCTLVRNVDSKEKCIMLDSDFFTKKREEKKHILDKLEFLHQRSTRLVRVVIKNELHLAMGPKQL